MQAIIDPRRRGYAAATAAISCSTL